MHSSGTVGRLSPAVTSTEKIWKLGQSRHENTFTGPHVKFQSYVIVSFLHICEKAGVPGVEKVDEYTGNVMQESKN